MTSIPTTAELLRLLREDPDFRDEVRRLVLSQDLLELPERFARFEAYVEQRFNSVEDDITTMKGDLGRLKGAEYERKVSRSFTSYASRAFRVSNNRRLRRNRLLLSPNRDLSPEFEETLADAVEGGQITDDELEDLREADAVMMGIDQAVVVYFVGEFSITVNNSDIDRAITRAAILSKATGCHALPMVIGETIPGPQRTRAEAEKVAFREVEQ